MHACSFAHNIIIHAPTRTHSQAVFEVDHEKGLTLTEFAEGVSVEDIRAVTKAPFEVCSF